jgi:hypothetical protein
MKKIARSLTLTLVGLSTLAVPANATIVDIASFLLSFDTADFARPTIIMNETETTFDLAITGSLVDHEFDDDTGSFSDEFILDFWRGNVTFGQVDGQINADSVTASISMWHQAGINRPHSGDVLRGDVFTFPSATLVRGDPDKTFGTTVRHQMFHNDRYYDGLFHVTGTGTSITGWNFTLKAEHVPEPGTWLLLATGGMGFLGRSWWQRKRA